MAAPAGMSVQGTYRGWEIHHDAKPIPFRGFDWQATSPDFDADWSDEDGFHICSGQQLSAASYDELIAEIDAAIEEGESE